MKKLLLLIFIVISQGCAIKISPSSGLDVLALNQIDNTSSVLVISQELQEKVYSSKPSFGVGNKLRTIDIYIGKPLTDHVYRQLKELLPNVKLEPQLSDLNYKIIIDLSLVNVEFGRLNDNPGGVVSHPIGIIFELVKLSKEVVSSATVSIKAVISGAYGTHNLLISGIGDHYTTMGGSYKKSLAKAIEIAIIDLSRKLAMCVEEIIKTPYNKHTQLDTHYCN